MNAATRAVRRWRVFVPGHSCLATETGTVAFLVYACRWLFVLRDVVFSHETGDAACFVEVLEGNHGLQERCLPFAEQK